MTPKIAVLLASIVCVASATDCFAQSEEFDPFKRNLIVVEGEADLPVDVNEFDIKFSFDIERSTFDEARIGSKALVREIKRVIDNQGIPKNLVIESWDLIKQSKIALGTKGRRISTNVTINVKDVPEGKLHEYVGKIIDAVLWVDRNIVLDNVSVNMTNETEKAKKQEALEKAVKVLEENAQKVAQSLNRKIKVQKRIIASSRQSLEKTGIDESDRSYSSYSSSSSYAGLSESVFKKAFRVRGDVVDHIYITAHVVGVYEIE